MYNFNKAKNILQNIKNINKGLEVGTARKNI
jgi:hypothetical protein